MRMFLRMGKSFERIILSCQDDEAPSRGTFENPFLVSIIRRWGAKFEVKVHL